MKGVRKIIFLLTVVTIVIASVTVLTVDIKNSGAQEENHIYEDQPAQTEPDILVENPVEPVEPVETQPAVQAEPPSKYTEEELEILAIIIYQEAGGEACSDDTRRMVGSVFLNRVASPYFPDTFEEVATGHKQYGTLYKTGIKWPDRAVCEGEAHAVERAYRLAEELLLSGSILPPDVIWQAEFPQGDGVYCQQEGFYFCYSEVSK